MVPQPPGLLWINEFGVWPSSENMELFNGYRGYLGERRSLLEAPGHVFGAGDLVALQCLTALSLYFSWDAFLVEGSQQLVCVLSHDEIMDIYVNDDHRLKKIHKELEEFGMSSLSTSTVAN